MLDLNPLDTIFRENPDYNASDHQSEMKLLCDRQKQIDNFLNGAISDDDLLDLLSTQGVNVDNYLEEVSENFTFYESQLQFVSAKNADLRARKY
jgi:hypothetical protein